MFENCTLKYNKNISDENCSIQVSYPTDELDRTIKLSIPLDEENTDYQAILKWIAEGNTIEEAD